MTVRTTKRSAGLLVYRHTGDGLEVLLGHMGGPLWAKKEAGAWTVPKGEYEAGEPSWEAARREFQEELGWRRPTGRPYRSARSYSATARSSRPGRCPGTRT